MGKWGWNQTEPDPHGVPFQYFTRAVVLKEGITVGACHG